MIHTAITAGTSRVAHGPLCVHAVANAPAGRMELVRSYDSIRFGLPTKPGRVGPCIVVFEACSAFTHVTACMLAESPMRPSTPKASAASLPPPLLRLLPGGANQFPGGFTPAVDHHLFTAHPVCRLTGSWLGTDCRPSESPNWNSRLCVVLSCESCTIAQY